MSILNRQIEAFRAVMLTGGMTAAAETMHVTQPAVSRLIRDLELDLKLELFRRRGNQITPTPEAHALLEEVERRFLALEQLRDFAKELSGARSGSLRIASLPAMAMGYLPKCIARFVKARPNLSILLDGMPSHLVLERVATGQFDVGFVEALANRPSIIRKPVKAAAVVVLPTGHRLAAQDCIRAADLKEERLIMLGRAGSYVRHSLETVLGHPQTQASIETPLSAIACAMVREGLGVTIVDPFSAASFDGMGVVVRRFEPAIDVGYALVIPRHRPISKLAQEFIDTLPITMA
jgi:DNA-binding transcriptional LysR family regulator